jgi:hypothetical protein
MTLTDPRPSLTAGQHDRPDPRLAARAELSSRSLVVHELVCTQPEVVAAARARVTADPDVDLAGWAVSLLEVGARAAQLAGASDSVDVVGRRIDELAKRAAHAAEASAQRIAQVVEGATDAETGQIAVAVGRHLERLTGEVRALVAGEDAPVRAAVERAVLQATGTATAEVQRALAAHTVAMRGALSVDDPTGPWQGLRRELLRTAEETRRELGEQVAAVRTLVEVNRDHKEMIERTAVVKGAAYESAALLVVDRVAHGMGDTCEPVGSTQGVRHGQKVGDAVVTVADRTARGRRVRLVVEAKDSTWGPDRWRRSLEAARVNRDAVAALGVVNGAEHMPGGRLVHFLDPLNCLVCLVPGADDGGVLAAAYQILRLQAVTTVLDGADADGLDVSAVRSAVHGAAEALAGFDVIDRAASGARRSLDQVGRASSELRTDLADRLARAARLLATAGDSGPEAVAAGRATP